MKRLPCLALMLVIGGMSHAAAFQRGENMLANGSFESPERWQFPMGEEGIAWDDSVAHSGTRSVRMTGGAPDSMHGIRSEIVFDPPVLHPMRVSGWSRAENAEVVEDYDVYLDVHYADGTPLWGQKACFEHGTHDWQYSELTFEPVKPVASIEVYVLFRKAKGIVWFDDIAVTLAPFELRDVQVLPGVFGNGLAVTAGTSLPAVWSAEVTTPGKTTASVHRGHGPIRLLAAGPLPRESTIRLTATDDLLHETITSEQIVSIPETASTPYALWTDTSMKRVMPYSLPDAVAAAPKAEIDLAGNEYESFQIAILPAPEHPLNAVRLKTADLVCAETGARISAGNIQWYEVGYVRLDRIVPHPGDPGACAGWWPDPLLPVESFNAVPDVTNVLWVTVYAPPGTAPGTYSGTITVEAADMPSASIPVSARVYGFELPVEGHLKTAFALMDGFLERVYGRPLDERLRIAYGDLLLAHRLNPDDISRTEPPVLSDIEHYASRGLNAFNVLNMVEERGGNTWVCWSPVSTYTPAFKQRLVERLDPYVAALRARGLEKKAYIYTFDERGEEFNPILREYFGMVKERYPELHTLTTAYLKQDPALLDDLHVDWACPVTPSYDLDAAERCRAAGHQVWAYVCMGPRYPYANILCDHPLIESRVLWWQAFQQKMDGILYWGLNIWDLPHNDVPIDPAKGPLLEWSVTTGGEYDWLHGDGRVLYAGKDGPIGSIRLENIRDGLEDYEYLYALAQHVGIDPARNACGPVTTGLTHFTRDPAVIRATRADLAAHVLAQ